VWCALAAAGIAVSVVTEMEVYQGLLDAPDPGAALAGFALFLQGAGALPVTSAIARRCAGIRRHLKAANRSVRPRSLDLLIAATAIEHGLTLVTRNTADYADVPGLALLAPPATPPTA
jgi:tRNA(fMet)-specific endonuclease VapC